MKLISYNPVMNDTQKMLSTNPISREVLLTITGFTSDLRLEEILILND